MRREKNDDYRLSCLNDLFSIKFNFLGSYSNIAIF